MSVPLTLHVAKLLEDPSVCKSIAGSHDAIELLLMQIQKDICTEANRDTVGPTLLALKHVQDVFHAFNVKGKLTLSQQNKEPNV